ncbi:hypothetical protein BLA55_00260 [Mycoplasmopsis pullorum]|uniref:AAA family ATPase n=2 Tax=Mycoplasmopsis pullorum TaxID=48003 RepID=A0A1L4FR95_9BACT|nr:hypothetical protein BLA55_00260 [Mycoplasmopsis pullorum]
MSNFVFQREKYLNQLIRKMNNGLIKIVAGLRRSGKSYLIFNLFKNYLLMNDYKEEQIIEIQLDHFSNFKYQNPEEFLNYVYSKSQNNRINVLLVDEIQLLMHFVPVLNELLSKGNYDIYVTGSNSKFLSSDVVTEFRGRGDVIHLFPLSFKEIWEKRKEDSNVLEVWNEYFEYGGIPLIVKLPNEDKKIFLKSLINETYFKDIVERNKWTKTIVLDELTDIIASNIGCITNLSNIKNTFKSVHNLDISNYFLSKYIEELKNSFLIEEAIKFNIKGRKYVTSSFKYFFTDMGLRNARLNFRQTEETHIMENVIYNELRSRGYLVDVGMVEQRTSTNYNQLEVDFVARKHDQILYIQSALNIDDPLKLEQETKSLLNIKDAFNKIVIVKNYSKMKRDENGIIYIGLFDFLLGEDWEKGIIF